MTDRRIFRAILSLIVIATMSIFAASCSDDQENSNSEALPIGEWHGTLLRKTDIYHFVFDKSGTVTMTSPNGTTTQGKYTVSNTSSVDKSTTASGTISWNNGKSVEYSVDGNRHAVILTLGKSMYMLIHIVKTADSNRSPSSKDK